MCASIAWECEQGLGIKRYITQAQYERFSPAIRRHYRPYKCANCMMEEETSKIKILEVFTNLPCLYCGQGTLKRVSNDTGNYAFRCCNCNKETKTPEDENSYAEPWSTF